MNTRRILLALLVAVLISTVASAQSQGKRTGWAAALERINATNRVQPQARPNLSNAQSNTKDSEGDRDDGDSDSHRDLTGSWLATVTYPDDNFSFKALFTFGEDGTFVGTSQGDVCCGAAETSQQGTWTKKGDDKSALKFLLLVYDFNTGELVATITVRFRIELRSRNRWIGQFTLDVTLPDGTTIPDAASGIAEGRRIRV